MLIVDDQHAMRMTLKFFLLAFDDLELVGEAANGEQALRLCGEVKPDVALMDLDMPGMDGISATRAIHQDWPQIKVVALTSLLKEETIQRLLQAEAINYLYKDISAEMLANAIRAAHLGHKNGSTF